MQSTKRSTRHSASTIVSGPKSASSPKAISPPLSAPKRSRNSSVSKPRPFSSGPFEEVAFIQNRLGHLPDRLRHMVSRGVPYSRGRHLRHRLHHGTYRVAVIYIGLPGPETPETEVQEGFGRKKEHRTFCEFAGLTRVGLIFMKSFRADRTDLGKAHTSNSRRQIKEPSSWA